MLPGPLGCVVWNHDRHQEQQNVCFRFFSEQRAQTTSFACLFIYLFLLTQNDLGNKGQNKTLGDILSQWLEQAECVNKPQDTWLILRMSDSGMLQLFGMQVSSSLVYQEYFGTFEGSS